MTQDNEPQFKDFEDKHFKIEKLKPKVDDITAEKPEVEKVFFHLPGDNPEKISCKPRLETTRGGTREVDGVEMDIEDDGKVKPTLKELPQIIKDVAATAKRNDELTEVKATVTRGNFTRNDGSVDTHYFVTNDNIDTIELVEHDEPEEDSTAEDFVEDQTNIETEEDNQVEEVFPGGE